MVSSMLRRYPQKRSRLSAAFRDPAATALKAQLGLPASQRRGSDSDFNPLSVQLVQQFVPLPDAGGNGLTASFSPVTNINTNQHIGRFDWNINAKDSLWFYSLANDSSSVNGVPFSGATLPGFGDQSVPFTKQFTGSWNHVFGSNVVNEFRLATPASISERDSR